MKIFKYILLVLVVGTFTSCEDFFSGDFNNEDPDNPITVSPGVILPQVQARLVYTYGGDFTRYIGIYSQHVDGVTRQFEVLGVYGIQPNDVDAMWANVYTGTLNSNRQLLRFAEENGANHYAGIALTIETYFMMLATDMWGDMPYSDALLFGDKGGLYQPAFDSQERIYDLIFSNLDVARQYFAMDNGGFAPGSNDLMYGGNAALWTKLCNVLEARAHLHLSKRNGASAYANALAALDKGGFESSADDWGLKFGANTTENAPWFQYIEQRDDCETGANYVAKLAEFNDPRIDTYGWPHDGDNPIFTKDQFVAPVTFTEQKFIEAEAALMANNSSRAYDAYLAGIESSMAEAQVSDGYADYVAQGIVGVGAGNLTMNEVITQKWLALYTNPEVFSDWRRTGLPVLSPNSGSQIPRRLPYAETEINSNPDNVPSPAEVTIYTRVWWDAN